MVTIVASDKWIPANCIENCGKIAGIGLADDVNNFTNKFCKNKLTPIVVINSETGEEFLSGL